MIKKMWILPVMAFMAACAKVPELPPISESGKTLPGKFIWRDLITPDITSAQKFYKELLGWEFEAHGKSGYSLIRHNGDLIGGMIDANKIGHPVRSAVWLNAVSVADVKQAARDYAESGGKVLHKPKMVNHRGRIAVVMDRDGAVLQLIQTSQGDPPDADPKMNQWLWTELMANDVAGSADFYNRVIGYVAEKPTKKGAADHFLMNIEGTPRAGMIENPFEDTRSAWIPFVRVANPGKLSAKVTELGGKVVIESTKTANGGSVAMILDPSGAPLALQQWSNKKAEDK